MSAAQPPFDLLTLPVIGRVARMSYGRLVMQIPFAVIALLLIYDGFTGPDKAAENLATVVPWVHYRGIVVLALLLVGNLFCMGCPFTIPRTLGKRFSLNKRRFPRIFRNKWLAILSLFALFFAYEYLDLWASPALTAWLIVAYFVGSFVLEAVFEESAFCKYVCPLGTFNFVYSTASPVQIGSKNLDVCRACVGKECVNGSYSPTPVIRIDEIPTVNGEIIQKTVEHNPQGTPGCGTLLFVPQIKSNMDCMLCFDCVRACPHDNVALFARAPGRELLQPDAWQKRWDISLLVISLAFLGMLNAFGMVSPVYGFMNDLARSLGLLDMGLANNTIDFIILLLMFIIGAGIIPLVLTLTAAYITRLMTNSREKYNQRETVAAFAPAFVPIGLGIWIAHYGFHFLIGALTIVPVFQNFVLDHGITILGGTPNWSLSGMSDTGLVGLIQVVALVGGFLWSMNIAQRTALRLYRRQGLVGFLPWAVLLMAMMLAALWIFSQKMEMRGTILFG